jgi:hypothetical protein
MTQLRSKAPALALIAFLLAYSAAGIWTALRGNAVDFAVYYLSAQALRDGADVYALDDADWASLAAEHGIAEHTRPYLYPPLTAGAVALFADQPYRTVLSLWNALSIGALLLSGLALSRLMSERWIDPLVFIALASYVPIWTTIYAGQVNTFVLLGIALFLRLATRQQPLAAGASLAASWLIKPLTAPLLAYLVWRRDARVLLGAAGGLVAAAMVSIALTGPQTGLNYLAHAGQLSTLSFGLAPVPYPPNQSVFGFFGRLLTRNGFAPALVDSPELARLFAIGVSALMLAGVAVAARPRRDANTMALETGLVLVTINLVVPTSWYHHAVIAIVPMLLAWRAARTHHLRVGLLVAFVLINAQGLLWHSFTGHTLLLSLGTYGLIMVYAVMVVVVWRSRRRETTPTVDSLILSSPGDDSYR